MNEQADDVLPFEVPAINNEKLALMRYLKLDGEVDADYDSVKELEGFKIDNNGTGGTFAVAVFEHNHVRYEVVHAAAKLDADVVQEFNSNLWRIRKVDGATE